MNVEPQFQENRGECGCGCGAFGRLLKNGHVARLCAANGTCPSCRGRVNKRSGHNKQRIARRALGVPDSKNVSALTNEEWWRGTLRVEVKSGAQCGPAWTRYIAAEAQSEGTRPVGDSRPFVAVLMPPGGGSEGLVQFRLSNLRDVVAALYEQLYEVGA